MLAIYIIKNTVLVLIWATQILMLIRAVLSWIPADIDNAFIRFVYGYTEIVITPVRALFDKLHLFEGFPLDMAFLVTFIFIAVIQVFLR